MLRAINVGGHNVKMDRLRALFEALPVANVTTVIASGNVLFTTRARATAALERRIETHLRQALGYDVSTFVRSADELAEVVAHVPFPHAAPIGEGTALSVLFLKSRPSPSQTKALCALRTATDEFAVRGREGYWLCHGRISDSKVTAGRVEKALGGPTTARNITTVRKLATAAVG